MALADCQVQVRDLVMGPGTPYVVQDDFNPFDRAVRAVQTGPRAWNHGSWSGAEWAEEAVVPIRVFVRDDTDRTKSGWFALHQRLAAAFAPVADTGEDVQLRWNFDGTEFIMRGRPRMVEPDTRGIKRGQSFTRCAFAALDPRIYSGEEHVAGPISLPSQAGGLLSPASRQNLVINPGFEINTTGWFCSGGTIGRSLAQAHSGVASGLVTPDGATATVEAGITASAAPAVTVDRSYRVQIWVYSPDGYDEVAAAVSWLNASNGTIFTDVGTTTAVPAGVWTPLTVAGTAPALSVKASPRVRLVGTPAVSDEMFVDDMRLFDEAVYGGGLIVPFTVGGTLIGGTAELTNAGTTDTGLLLRIDGPVEEPFIILSRPDGDVLTLRIRTDLDAGQWLEVDTAARTVFLNGLPTANRRGQAVGDFPLLPPGTSTIRFGAADLSTGTLTVRWRDAWW